MQFFELPLLRIVLLLIFPVFVHKVTATNPYGPAKQLVKFLETVPTITDNPFEEFRNLLNKILKQLGIEQLIYGNYDTNKGRVTGPVRVTRPPISSAIYYHQYALATMCGSSLEKWECPNCKVLGKHIKLVTVYANPYYHTKWFVVIDDKRKEIVLAFRPSLNLATILVSFTAAPSKFPDNPEFMIHSGFLKAVSADFDRILAVLKQVTSWNPTYKLILTGLSLGGQMSSVMTFMLKYRNSLPNTHMELYTYGQARCGNKAYADFMNNLTIPVARVVNGDDLIPRVALAALGYYHHHNELFLLDDGQGNRSAHYCSTEFYEDPECSATRGAFPLLQQPTLGYIDHLMHFSIDPSDCILENPVEFFLQILYPFQLLIPPEILAQIPAFAIDTNIVLDFRYLVTSGYLNLYRAASKSSTYYYNTVTKSRATDWIGKLFQLAKLARSSTEDDLRALDLQNVNSLEIAKTTSDLKH